MGGICIACTMPGFPDKYLPLMDSGLKSRMLASTARFAYGPLLRHLRNQSMKRRYEVEPEWRRPGAELASGYRPRW